MVSRVGVVSDDFRKQVLGYGLTTGANSLSHAGSPFAAADLRLAELRSVSEIPGAEGFFWRSGRKSLMARCSRSRLSAFQADQAG